MTGAVAALADILDLRREDMRSFTVGWASLSAYSCQLLVYGGVIVKTYGLTSWSSRSSSEMDEQYLEALNIAM